MCVFPSHHLSEVGCVWILYLWVCPPAGWNPWVDSAGDPQFGSVRRHKSKYLGVQTLLMTINYHNSPWVSTVRASNQQTISWKSHCSQLIWMNSLTFKHPIQLFYIASRDFHVYVKQPPTCLTPQPLLFPKRHLSPHLGTPSFCDSGPRCGCSLRGAGFSRILAVGETQQNRPNRQVAVISRWQA